MKGDFAVRYTDDARDDLLRRFEFLLLGAETIEDLDAAQLALDTIRTHVEHHLSRTPFVFRKHAQSPFQRELLIPFRGAGYVALYEIETAVTVTVLAVRHQLEDDYN
jgi:plasmid stabilization system protein ParE